MTAWAATVSESLTCLDSGPTSNSVMSTNSNIHCLGVPPTRKWNALTWGVDPWGADIALMGILVGSGYAESESLSAGEILKVVTGPDNYGSVVPADAVPVGVTLAPQSSVLTPTHGQTSETLGDGGGYLYSFPDPTSNAENRDSSSFTCAAVASGAWTSGTAAVTTWS